MNCEKIRDYFMDYIDGSLNEKERQMVESHLRECKDCREELVMLKALVNDMDTDREEIQVPEDFMNNLRERVSDTQFKGKRKIKPLRTLLIAAVILTMSVVTVFAAKEPILELIKRMNPQSRISTIVYKGIGSRLNISKTDKNIKITITEVLADDIQTLISYKIEDVKNGKNYYVPDLKDISIKEKWGEAGESDMDMHTSQYSFEGKSTLTLFPIDTEEKKIHLTLKKVKSTVEGDNEIIEGNWDFEIPIRKYNSKSYELNKTLKIDNYTIDFTKITIAPTITTLYFNCKGGIIEGNILNDKLIGLEDLILIADGKEYKPYDFGHQQWNAYSSLASGSEYATFETAYFDNPKDIEVKIRRLSIHTREEKTKEFIINLGENEKQEFEYRGSKLTIDNIKLGEKISLDVNQSSDYCNIKLISYIFQPVDERYFTQVGSYTDYYYLDKEGKKYDYAEALLIWDKIRDKNPIMYIPKISERLQPKGSVDIKKEKFLKMLIDGYVWTKFVDGTIKIKLQ